MMKTKNVSIPEASHKRLVAYSESHHHAPLIALLSAAVDFFCEEFDTSAEKSRISSCVDRPAVGIELSGLVGEEVVASHLVRFPSVTPAVYQGFVDAAVAAQKAKKGPRNVEAYLYTCCSRFSPSKRPGEGAGKTAVGGRDASADAAVKGGAVDGMTSDDLMILENGTAAQKAAVRRRLGMVV